MALGFGRLLVAGGRKADVKDLGLVDSGAGHLEIANPIYHVLELKVWRDRQADPLKRGLDQLGRYLESLSLDHVALLIFDRGQVAGPLAERSEISELEHRMPIISQ